MSGQGETLILRWWNYQVNRTTRERCAGGKSAAILRIVILPSVWELTATAIL